MYIWKHTIEPLQHHTLGPDSTQPLLLHGRTNLASMHNTYYLNLITCMFMSHVAEIILNLINFSDNVGATLHSDNWHKMAVAVIRLLPKSRLNSQKGNHTAPFPCFSQCFPSDSFPCSHLPSPTLRGEHGQGCKVDAWCNWECRITQ